MSLNTDLKTFQRLALSPSRLRSFHFCEAQSVIQKRASELGLRLRGLKIGSIQHEVDFSWNVELLGDLEPVEIYTVGEALDYLEEAVRWGLKKRLVLANTFRVRTFASMVQELVPGRGLLGYPDAVDCRDGMPVIVEEKYTTPPTRGIWPGDRIQVLGYLAGLDELGWVEPHARVVYRGRVAEMAYTDEDALFLRRIARRLVEVEDGAEPVLSYRCGYCFCWEVCPWRKKEHAEHPSTKTECVARCTSTS